MLRIEKVTREYNGKENEVKLLAGLGNLTADIETRIVTTKSGEEKVVAGGYKQSIAFNWWENGEKKPVFFPIEAWEKTAELLGKFGKKGVEMMVIGRLETRTYTSKQGKQYTNEYLIIEQFQVTSRGWKKVENNNDEKETKEEIEEVEEKIEVIEEEEEDIEGFSSTDELDDEVYDEEEIPF